MDNPLDKKGESIQLLDIFHKVFIDEDDNPWICPCEVIKISPKGRVITFNAIDTRSKYVFKELSTLGNVSKTKVEALKLYQKKMITSYSPLFNNTEDRFPPEQRVLQIIKAQKLIDKMTFCPTI